MTDPQISLPFSGSVDESTDPRHLPPGTLVSATNGVFDADGQLQVRYGYTMLSTTPSSIFRLAVFAFELVAITLLGACSSYSLQSGFDARDITTPIGVTHTPLTNSSTGYNSWGMTVVNGYRVVGWIDAQDGFPRASVYDVGTGAVVLSTMLATHVSKNLYIGAVGNVVIVTTADTGPDNIRAFTLQTSPLGVWSAGTVISDANYQSTVGMYSAAFGSNIFTIAYENVNGGGAGNSEVTLIGSNAALAQQYNQTLTLANGTHNVEGIGSRLTVGEQGWVFLYAVTSAYTNHVIACPFTPATGVGGTPFSVGFDTAGPNGAMQLASARLNATTDIATVSDGLNTWVFQLTNTGVVANSTVEMFHVRTASAPTPVAALGTTVTLMSDPFGSPSSSYFLMDLLTRSLGLYPQLVTVLAPGIVSLANQPSFSDAFPATTWSVDASGNLTIVAPINETSSARQGLELFTASVLPNYLDLPASLGKEGYLGGLRYDGRLLVEAGFAQQPSMTVANVTGSGTTYQYTVTWGWIDAHGNLEESSPSPIQSIVSGATPSTTLTINTTGISRKQRSQVDAGAGKIVAIVYRTQSTASGDTTFYRVTQEPFALLNDPTASTISYSDTLSDADLTDGTHPVLYIVSGELNHNTPETFSGIVAHQLRVWGIGADQRSIWWSSQYVDGVVPFFNDSQILTVDDAGEPLTALASLYDKLLIFTPTKVYVVYGSGPSPAGTGNDLTPPQRIPSPAGCIDPRSIVQTPMGVFFQSQRGLELVGPDLSVSFVGQPVSTTTATFPIVTSAAMVEANSVIRWTLVNSETPASQQAGRVLNFDMRRGRWTVHQLTSGGSKGAVAAAPETAVTHPILGYVEGHNDFPSGSIIARENTTADATPWLDYGATFIPLSWKTGWIKNPDLQGWGTIRRVLVLGNYYDNHGLSFGLSFDYQPAVETHAFSDATIFSTFGSSWEQIMLHPGIARRCEAIQVSGTTVAPATEAVNSGRGAGFVGLAVEARPQKGSYRNVPTSARG